MRRLLCAFLSAVKGCAYVPVGVHVSLRPCVHHALWFSVRTRLACAGHCKNKAVEEKADINLHAGLWFRLNLECWGTRNRRITATLDSRYGC